MPFEGGTHSARHPYGRDTLLRRGAGFLAVMAGSYAAIPFSTEETSPGLVAAAAALNVALLLAAWFLPWTRLPRAAAIGPPLAYVAVVVLLREGEGGGASGFAGLFLASVLWTALYMDRTALWVTLAAVAVALVAPVLIEGAPRYPAGTEVRRTVATMAIALLMGFVAQELVQRSRRRAGELAAVLRAAGEGIVRLGASGEVILANPAAAEILGRPAADLTGKDFHATVHDRRPDGSPYPAEECPIRRTLGDGQSAEVDDEVFWRADGSAIPVEYRARPLARDAGGGAVVTFSDITERLRVQRMKDEFVSVVGHELRTPLTAIRGSLGLMGAGMVGDMSAEARDMLDIAVENTDRLVRLINDILDIERIESGRVAMEREPCDLADILQRMEELMATPAREAGVELAVEPVPARLWADSDRILQVLTNLVSNALKFTPWDGKVTVRGQEGEGEVTVSVEDTGRGIPPEQLETVFERFAQVDASDAREKGGTGLGLAIARSIVHQHFGRIWVESEPGRGARFSFTLPLTRVVSGPRPTAVVAGCDRERRARTRELLERAGYDAGEAEAPDEVAARAEASRPDVLLVDLGSYGEGGAELIDEIRRRPETADVPVLSLATVESGDDGGRVLDESLLAAALRTVPGASPLTALVVEDDASLARVLVGMLRALGVRATHTTTAAGAIDSLREHHPDLLILDLVLPGGDGAEVVDWLRGEDRLLSTPVLVYTALDLGEEERNRLASPETRFFTKSREGPEAFEQQLVAVVDRLSGGDRQ